MENHKIWRKPFVKLNRKHVLCKVEMNLLAIMCSILFDLGRIAKCIVNVESYSAQISWNSFDHFTQKKGELA
jgi:hypothetical protein